MSKNIEWAKKQIDLEVIRRIGREEPQFYVNVGLKMALDFLNQLDEPEITELDALNRLAENVQFSVGEIASHLEKLSAYNGQVTYGEPDEPEVLSSDWIDEHAIYIKGPGNTISGYLEGLADKEPINPERSLEVDKHKELLDELNDLYARKNQDYGNSFEEAMDEDGLIVLKIRLKEKLKRFSVLMEKEQSVMDESMRDTLVDLANYAVMGVMWLDVQEEEETVVYTKEGCYRKEEE